MNNATKVTIGNILEARYACDNLADESRNYNITANVRVENGKVTNIESGEIRLKNEAEGQTNIASFSSYSDSSLNINYYNTTARAALLTEAESFISGVKEKFATNE